MEEFTFQWDEYDRRLNVEQYGIDFADINGLFYDDQSIIMKTSDYQSQGEQYFLALGEDIRSQVIIVMYVYEGRDVVRIMSARQANPQEYKQFTGDE